MKSKGPNPTEAEIIVKMRLAMDVVKAKWQEAEGPWALVDFLGAATKTEGQSHWMDEIVEAERLSEPYMKAVRK